MQISHHKVVSAQYTLSNDAGEVIDSSEAGDPLVYLHGEENIIPGLESALTGKAVGDKLKVSLDAVDAYGEYDNELVETVSAGIFEGVDKIEVGMEFETELPDEEEVEFVRVTAVDGDNVTIDGNHPFAGMRLHFDITIEAIREATEEEIEHGHVHGGECCGEGDCDEEGGCCN
ncbi:MAG: peptidylprolyl isomerase [Zetaproteobacteria bacterium CG12_big_fil_rev_8_21_14_0_65_54_13]|nr:MAG: peptidylprolyl isomerase [Zetaproteobacteria bacterium CG12_big_fil_rev_8_21_14_0_65_54_13]PIX53771.1 MAG: peptidylprolyl isomerase [Zetaproteobacteria bacterium CG_4_10_14_3_um_filter_54_28]PJA30638.1 MAG: peptidylprolyl isomerase [Zetaproteobacteria bacterium CG_4_9_14_3_um_filter_54_145]